MNYIKSFYNWITISDEDAERAQNSLYLDVNTGIFADFNDTANKLVLQIINNNVKNDNNVSSSIDDIRFFSNGNFEFTIHKNSPYFPVWVDLNSDIKIKGNISNYIPDKTYIDTMQVINHIQSVYLPIHKKSSNTLSSQPVYLHDCDNIDYLYINGIMYIETVHYKIVNTHIWKCINYLQKSVPLIIGNYYMLEATKIQ